MTENSTPITPHPLDGVNDWECYDQHISERNKLTAAKREAEDGFVKTIIQLSSTITLAVPGLLALNKSQSKQPSLLLITGVVLIGMSLICALTEQFLSSVAYDKQIKKTENYYKKVISDISPPRVSHYVKVCLLLTFVLFIAGVSIISSALLISPWRETVAQTPSPRPSPPRPTPSPTPKHDVPGRSVPPTPPPSPPTSPRR